MWADAGFLCTESCTDSWRHWFGSLCGQAARRILRSSCCATNSACCADRSTDPRSPTPTGACSGRARPRSRDLAEPGGWSPPTHCCVGTGAASSGTGPNHSDRRADRRPQQSFADSHCASQLRIRLGDTAASTANSPASATASLRPRSGRSSTTPESTPPPHAQKSPGRSSCGPRALSPATSPPSKPSRCAGSTCCSSSTSPPEPCSANAFAERWIGTLRRELLDRTIIWNRRQLNKLVVDYIDHYNTHRPHRSLDQRPPVATDPPNQPDSHLQVVRTARCGGLINEYRNAA